MTRFWSDKRQAAMRRKTGVIPGVHHALCFDSLPSAEEQFPANIKTKLTLPIRGAKPGLYQILPAFARIRNRHTCRKIILASEIIAPRCGVLV